MYQRLQKKSVLILGYGREGKDTHRFLRSQFPSKEIAIADLKEKEVTDSKTALYFGEDYLDAARDYDLIIKSPGVPYTFLAQKNISPNKITSQSDIFLNLTEGEVIGITGTKGKSTTATAIHQLFKNQGVESFLIGNIGNPALDFLGKKAVFVYELSSFQLQTISRGPDLAIILNIFKDHLDQHSDYDEYFNSKKKIISFYPKPKKVIFNGGSEEVGRMVSDFEGEKIPFDPKERLAGSVVYADPIRKVADHYGIDPEGVDQIIKDPPKLKHRLEFVGNYGGIDFYDDSAATIPEATIRAIAGLETETLITGGVDKGGDYKKLSLRIENSNIKNLILFPDTGKKIANSFSGNIFFVGSMEEAVKKAFQITNEGAVLLSPASSSFNMFSSYVDRGDKFKKAIQKYGQK